jgi:hypothetical protein
MIRNLSLNENELKLVNMEALGFFYNEFLRGDNK